MLIEHEIAILAIGSMVAVGVEVRNKLKEKGFSCSLVNARFVKPIDEDMVVKVCEHHTLIVTMEENVASGGFGEKVRKTLCETKQTVDFLSITIPDDYVEHGNVELLKKEIGIDVESITDRIMSKVNRK